MERTEQLNYFAPLPDDFEKHIERVEPVPRGKSVSRRLARTDTTYFAVNQLGLKPYYWQSALWDEWNAGKSTAVCSARQVGKEQPYSATIITPQGLKTMGELTVGDEVFSEKGTPTKVVAIYEQGVKPVYEIEFTDGSKTRCGKDHLWKFKTAGKDRPWRVAPLKELIEKWGVAPISDKAFRIPLTQPVEWQARQHKIHPYVLGLLIGDGGFSGGTIKFSTVDEELLSSIKELTPEFELVHESRCNYRLTHPSTQNNPYICELKRLGLWGKKSQDKFIPHEYLFDSIQGRKELLRGLMDSDGSIYGNCVMEYSTTSPELAEGFKFLVQSLGGKCLFKSRDSWATKDGVRKQGLKSYRLFPKFWDLNPFKLERKANKYYNIKYEPTRILKKITEVAPENSRCIQVADESHTYLTDEFIVTHNTAALAIFTLQACFYNTQPLPTTKRTRIIIVSKSEGQSKKVISDIREWMRVGDERVLTLTGGKVENFFTREIARGQDSTNTKGTITFANGCEVISLPPTDSARGFTGSWLFLDEAAFFPDERIFTQTLRPIVSQTGNKIGMISTPNGQQGFFFKYFDPFNKSEDHEFVRMWVPYTALKLDDSSLVYSRDQMRKQEFALGNEREFEQEHMASFNSSAESFFNPDVIDKATIVDIPYEEFKGPCDLGVDFGVGKQSRTVMTISAKIKRDEKQVIRQLYQYEYPPDKDLTLVQDIKDLMKSFALQRVIFEDCGAAEAHRQSAEKEGLPLFMFNPSRDKGKKYFALRSWLNRGLVHLLNIDEQTKQFKGMILENTASGRVKIYHGAGLRDDRVDSFMLSTAYLTEEESGFRVWDVDDY